jgi:enoyl-CoA hydratase/carnithine racemase
MFLGKEISAEMALNIGLVNEVCKPESLDRILKKTANMIVEKDHLALRIAKKFINENQDIDIEGVLGRESIAMITTGQSEKLREKLKKFVEH